MKILTILLLLTASPVLADVTPPAGIDVHVLGEVHDNPTHHVEQARLTALIAPKVVVWEMLTPEQAAAIDGVDRGDRAAMEAALAWADSGWPDFAMYHPIFVAAGDAVHVGAALPRAKVRRAVEEGAATVLGAKADGWSMGPLPEAEQTAREEEQQVAHCNALPVAMLGGMVEAQRMRDWALASAAVTAVEAGQGPVVVITGSGHARKDWGVPALIAAARPGVSVWSLGQVEGAFDPDAPFDAVVTAPAPEREDPCLTFAG
jgi:uncharacterized iron-regulated protein